MFASRFPSIPERLEALRNDWQGDTEPGPYTQFNQAVGIPILESLLDAKRPDRGQLRTFFDCVEDLFARGDPDIETLLKVEVVERLTSNDRWMKRAQDYLGPLTVIALREYEIRIGWLAGSMEDPDP